MAYTVVKVPGTLNRGVDRPKLYPDPLLTNGSLMLVDPSHPVAPWGAGVPSGVVPNLATAPARALVGEAPLDAVIELGAANTASLFTMERTEKGGLHGIVSQAAPMVTGVGAKLIYPPAILNYLNARRGNAFYFSIWFQETRIAGATDSASPFIAGVGAKSSPTGQYLYAVRSSLTRPSTGAMLGIRPSASGNDALGTTHRNVAAAGWTGSNLDTAIEGSVVQWGSLTPTPSGAAVRKHLSGVFYRAYLEDLTVSGRSYATVDAADHALYVRDVETPGGRYNGDTFTDPVVIP